MQVTIFTTGGTIDKVYFDAKGGYTVGEPMAPRLLANARVTLSIEIAELMRKDSLELTEEDRARVVASAAASAATRIVITHGTDTMVETGLALRAVAGKTIVLTGALQPGRFTDSDAAFNLGMAIAAAQVLPAGVYVAANGELFDIAQVRKNRDTGRFERRS